MRVEDNNVDIHVNPEFRERIRKFQGNSPGIIDDEGHMRFSGVEEVEIYELQNALLIYEPGHITRITPDGRVSRNPKRVIYGPMQQFLKGHTEAEKRTGEKLR